MQFASPRRTWFFMGSQILVDKIAITNNTSAFCDRFYEVLKTDSNTSNYSADIKIHPESYTNDTEGDSARCVSSHEGLSATSSRTYDWETKVYKNMDLLLPPSKSEQQKDSIGVGRTPIHPPGIQCEFRPWERTIHIHLNKYRPFATELRSCILDTGSDFNYVSQRALRDLPLKVAKDYEMSEISGLGGRHLPIGSVFLTWHMDRQEHVVYGAIFWVLSDDELVEFEVILGLPWISERNALLRNPEFVESGRTDTLSLQNLSRPEGEG
ncbi:hypothetical protein GJ744_011076 [Endocarpon pusillum]|uniref:Peptidase A2 domain-containing protein n=1 Tax=Endocarpon pusillum TaxID=364733 RepID=A0A8H7AKU5_9EURO|nr:hypothetical protein GJ744_011076 [Endocarpon pusillum]